MEVAAVERISVKVSVDRDRQYRVYFEKDDVRRACRMLPCSDHAETCIRQMEKKKTTCELCYAVLSALKKSSVKARFWK
jgi:hypothetical protein